MAPNIYWKAVYSDGTYLSQHNGNGTENKYYDIDRTKLVAFEVYNNDNLILRRHLESGQRLIFRLRSAFSSSGKEVRILLVGWQQTIGGENVQEIAYIFPNHIELSGKWKDKAEWLYAPKLIECERGDGNAECDEIKA